MKIQDPTLTITVPCYNEEAVLPLFYQAMRPVMDALPARCTLLFVDDGSKDATLNVIKRLAENDAAVKYISFSRNFGKEAAMLAGLENAKGDYVVLMDADLQDPPELIPDMLQIIQNENVDCVGTRRVTRKGEPPIRSFFARGFYRLFNSISKIKLVDGARDFRMMSRRFVDAVLSLGERERFSKGLFAWVGFETRWLEYENRERAAGETKWSFFKLLMYSFDGISAFSTAPLSIATYMGLFCGGPGTLGLIYALIASLASPGSVSSLLVICSLALFLGGATMLCIGISGIYLAKSYTELKARPSYIIREKN